MFGRRILVLGLLLLLGKTTQCAELEEHPVVTCPGIKDGDCGPACRVAVCQALADFYDSTHNTSQPWVNNFGWNKTATQPCATLAALHHNSTAGPDYCNWHGVACCHPSGPQLHEQHTPLHHCSPIWSVKALDLQVNNLNGSLDSPRIMASLLQLHACGLVKLQLQGNGLSGSMASPGWGEMTSLFYLDLASNWITGTLPESFRRLTKLERLSMGSNLLHGSLPLWIGEDLPSLEVLNLGVNTGINPGGTQGLSGTLPASLGKLSNLTVLNLELNALVGVLPAGLCRPDSKLRALKLRGNRLSGSIEQLMSCVQLTQLDISSNNFSGPFGGPNAVGIWPQLAVLDASSNGFEGSLPLWVYELPMLEFLNLANNRFSGPIRRHIMLSTYLKEINLEYNQLSGPIDESLWMLPHLRLLDLSHNRFSGSISGMIGRTSNLEELQLGDNDLTGPVPPQLGLLKKINVVNLAHNAQLSCLQPWQHAPAPPSSISISASTGNNTPAHVAGGARQSCREEQLLPCFLYFANYTVPRTDNSKMACPAILRRHIAEARMVCAGDAPGQLGSQSHNVADALAADEQSWKIEPSYYQYRGCRCFSGFVDVWREDDTVLTCMPELPQSKPPWVQSLIEAMSVSGAMLLAAVGLLVWMRMAVALRPRWRREKELQEHRKKGVPCGAPATIVVTDIEAYSELMQSNAPLTTKALGIHNSILRRAASAHAGHVIEQEGDSWSVAFHTPMDAVAFCLQVQQALHKTNWPRDMGAHLNSAKSSFETEGTDVAAAAGACQQPWEVQLGRCSCNGSSCPLGPGAASPARLLKHSTGAGWVMVADRKPAAADLSRSTACIATPDAGCGAALSGSPVSRHKGSSSSSRTSSSTSTSSGLDAAATETEAEAGMRSNGSSSSSFSGAIILDGSTRVGNEAAVPGKLRHNSNGGSRSSRFLSMIGLSFQGSGGLAGKAAGPEGAMQGGLRVRMGVASGVVPAGSNIGNCSLLQLAKAVSDMANGGQILLEACCCAGVRDRLTELGAVDARGYNDMQLAHAARAAMRQQTSGLLAYCLGRFSSCLACSLFGQSSQLDNDALMLDMGEYYVPTLAPVIPAAASGSSSGTDGGAAGAAGTTSTSTGMQRVLAVAGQGRAAMAAAAGAVVSACTGKGDGKGRSQQLVPDTLQLYSILPPSLVGRAKRWGSGLNFKQGSETMARPFFDAPGTDVAELQHPALQAFGSPCCSLAVPLLVTMVFCCVEGGSTKVHRRPEVARLLHSTLSRLMQALLLALPAREGRPDGYLARQQEGELKYMLAFNSPARAVEWAMLLQEVLQHVPWPGPVLEAFASSCSSSTSRAELRTSASSSVQDGSSCSSNGRPQLKIGLAEGQPQCIGPDHLGRANYHAPFVNLAARMLDAAHGGQVVTSIELAQSIFSTWCYEAELIKCHKAMVAQPAKHSQGSPAAAPGPQQLQHDHQMRRSSAEAETLVQLPQQQPCSSFESLPHQGWQCQQWQQQQQLGRHQHQDQQSVQQQLQEHQQQQEATSSQGASPHCQTRLVVSSSGGLVAPPHQLLASQASWNGLEPAGSCQKLHARCWQPTGALLPTAAYPMQHLRISGWHIGCYAFKGCGTTDMVTFTGQNMSAPLQQQAMQQQQHQLGGAQHRGKGILLLPRSGPVVGLQNCPVVLPNVLPVLHNAWNAASEVFAQGELRPHAARA